MSGLGLLDVLPLSEKITINGKEIVVHQLSGRGIGELLQRFPDLIQVFDKSVEEGIKFDIMKRVSPQAIAPIIAAACGNAGDPRAEAIADALSLPDQIKILKIVHRLTMPEGFGPFVAELNSLLDFGVQEPSAAPSSPLPKRPRPSAQPQAQMS